MVADIANKHKPFSAGQTVKIKPQVEEYGGKLGTVVGEGPEHGWHVVRVKFDSLPRPIAFAPDEVEGR